MTLPQFPLKRNHNLKTTQDTFRGCCTYFYAFFRQFFSKQLNTLSHWIQYFGSGKLPSLTPTKCSGLFSWSFRHCSDFDEATDCFSSISDIKIEASFKLCEEAAVTDDFILLPEAENVI